MKRNPTLPPYLCWVTRSLHPTYKTTVLTVDEVYIQIYYLKKSVIAPLLLIF
ncbi:hypothetical protein [Nostoc sp. UCD121]|uniref:hypothetical protein n=1 Tax=Nostoc sp. UCD121 TaxID=2681305 RepID=UPI0016275683|nr:hypothetical protein [Nostoc sp. UCD121]MBC1223049.1 hypothetical protein [Nostoc sp. UCD120]